MATTYLYRDATSEVSVQKATISTWVKRSNITDQQHIYFCGYTANYDHHFFIRFNADGTLRIHMDDGGTVLNYITNRVFRDNSGWYHIVVTLDLTETGNDRCKLYINGVLETSYSTQTAMTGDQWYTGKSGYRVFIGYSPNDTPQVWNGLMSHIHYIDGTAYQASTFGSTDATTGEWTITTEPTVTYGTNGFFILENGNGITDQSGEGNNLTLGAGTLTATEDNPSNVFCALNPLNTTVGTGNAPTYANGNNYVITGGTSASDFGGSGTLGVKKGVWYYEGLVVTSGDDNLRSVFGISSNPVLTAQNNQEVMWNRYSYCWKAYNGAWWTNTNATPANGTENVDYLNTYTNGDYIGVYFDLDNSKMIFSKNGVLERSGVSDAITAVGSTDTGFYFPIYTDGHSGWSSSAKLNFGNGSFGDTALTGSEDVDWFRDAGEQGKFKYNPTQTIDGGTWNARAICTKNINTYG